MLSTARFIAELTSTVPPVVGESVVAATCRAHGVGAVTCLSMQPVDCLQGRMGIVPAAAVLVWVPAVLWLDRGASLGQQRLLGLLTWGLLLLLLRREAPLVRVQTVVVVVFAT